MIVVTKNISLAESELTFTFMTAQGPGGQNVNKVATAVQLRFNVLASPSLADDVRLRLIALLSKRLTTNGEVIIKANRYRTQERNKQDAISRLCDLIKQVAVAPKKRKKTRPTLASKKKRLEQKKRHSQKKALRKID